MSGRRSGSGLPAPPNRPIWPISRLLRQRLRAAQDRFGGGEQPGAVAVELSNAPALDQIFDLLAVELPRIDARGEIGDVRERPVAARGDQACIAAMPTFLTAASA